MSQENRRLPLEGVRIADFTWVMAGPASTRHLGALGAEVIKITSQRRPDSGFAREAWSPQNFNKKCCTINISEPGGVELAKNLIAVSDVMVESFGSGAMERAGLGYAELRQLRADLIYISSSGQGRTGPDKDHVAYGSLISCFTGFSSVTGFEGVEPFVPHYWTDPLVGITLANTIIACLYHRRQTGLGQYVDLSMTETAIALLIEPLMDFVMNQRVQGPIGNKDEYMAPHGAYECKGRDEWVAVAVTNDVEWLALCGAMGRDDLANNPKYATTLERWKHQKEIDQEVTAWTRERSNNEVMELLQAVSVPSGASIPIAQLSKSPHLQDRGFIRWVDRNGERRPIAGLPWRNESGPAWHFFPPPKMGADNDYVARELLGISDADIERLVETKALY